MRLRNTLLLALLFAALGGYVYFVELQRDPVGDETAPLLSFEKGAVTQIELEHPGRRVVLRRQDGRWRMLEPLAASADERAVENLLDAVHESRISRTLEDPGDLTTYALDVPSATVRVHSGTDDVATIKVGKKTPVGTSAYVQRDGEESVLLTDAALVSRIDLDSTALRDKTILAFELERVESVQIRNPQGAFTLEKPDSAWRIASPVEHDADGTAVGNFLSTLQSMRATEFYDDAGEQLQRYGLAEPARVIVLGMKDDRELELRVGNERDGKLRLQTGADETVYAVAAWLGDSLDRDVNYFREKSISRFVAGDAATMRIESADEPPLEFRRTSDGWMAVEAAAADSTVDEIVGELASLRGFEIAAEAPENLAEFGLDPPQRSLQVSAEDGAILATVRIGSYVTDGAQTEYTAIGEGSTTVFHLRQFEFATLATPRERLLARPQASEGSASPVPDGGADDDVDEDSLDDAATAGE